MSSKQFVPALTTLLLAIVGSFVSGLAFSHLETASLLACLSLVVSTIALLSQGMRDLLIRTGLLLLCLAGLRACGSYFHSENVGSLEFFSLWLILLLIVFASLNLCLLPLGLSIVSALRMFLPKIGSEEYLHDKKLWYLNWLVFMPLITLVAPIGMSFLAWTTHNQSRLGSYIRMNPVSAIAIGISLPLAAVTSFVFTLREAGSKSSNKWVLEVGGLSIGLGGFFVVGTTIYGLGLWLEHDGPEMYALWTVCWAILLATILILGRLSSVFRYGLEAMPERSIKDLAGQRDWRKNIAIFVWLYMFSFVYFELLSSVLRR